MTRDQMIQKLILLFGGEIKEAEYFFDKIIEPALNEQYARGWKEGQDLLIDTSGRN